MEVLKIEDYEIKVSKEIKLQVIGNQYYRGGLERIHLNQCPICGHTNVNMDPWILACIGDKYLYLYKNFDQNPRIIIRDVKRVYDFYVKADRLRYHHLPVQMYQEIIFKKDAKKLKVNDK